MKNFLSISILLLTSVAIASPPPNAPPTMPPNAPPVIPGLDGDEVGQVAFMSVPDDEASSPPVAPPVRSLETPRLRFYTATGCGPCEAFKSQSIPRLEAIGWEVGRNIEIVDAGSIPAPRFEWVTDSGVVSTLDRYNGREAFNAWHRAAVEGVKAVKAVANGCQCGADCPCAARVSYSGPRKRVPNPDFVMTELVEPTAVFTEYPEPQGALDPAYQVSYESPQVVQQVAYQSGNCASGMCGPMQSMPMQQHSQGYWTPPAQSQQHSQGARRGPVRRILGGLFSGGCFGGMCR